MLYKTIGAAVYGIDANLIEVEVDIASIKEQDHRGPARRRCDLPMAPGILGA